MRDFFRWLFSTEPHYLITISYTKHKIPCRSKYSRHAGNSINNRFTQIVVKVSDPMTLIDDLGAQFLKDVPNAQNIKITTVQRID